MAILKSIGKFYLVALVMVLPLVASAQDVDIAKLYSKYSGADGVTSVSLSKDLIGLMVVLGDEEDPEVLDMVKKIESVKLLKIDSREVRLAVLDKFNRAVKSLKYSVLAEVKENDSEIMVLAYNPSKREGDFISKIAGLGVVIKESDNLTFIYLDGDIDFKQLSKLSKTLKVSGLSQLDKL